MKKYSCDLDSQSMTSSVKRNKTKKDTVQEFRGQMLRWYDKHRRTFPWRAAVGTKPDPYKVWLSEIMLQQTTVAAAGPYFTKFTGKWPDVHALAKAQNEDIMANWAGLGYYARARNLHKCAKIVSEEMNGRFPGTQEALQELPGIGDYTSAAIASIVFDRPAAVIDANVERVITRYYAIEIPLPESKKEIRKRALRLAEGQTHRPGDFGQAMMDLGATICTPSSPKCGLCPLQEGCKAHSKGIASQLPKRLPKQAKPKRYGYVYWVQDKDGQVLVHKRPDKGLLGGMRALPTTEWLEKKKRKHLESLGTGARFLKYASGPGIFHSFTHFDLELTPIAVQGLKLKDLPKDYSWCPEHRLSEQGFPTVFRKAYNFFYNSDIKLKESA